MKRILSLLLTVVMCVSVFSATATEVFALGSVNDIFTVTDSGFKNDKITYKIALKPNLRKVSGAIIAVKYDSSVLAVSEDSGASGVIDSDGNFVENVYGIYEKGNVYNDANTYSIAFMNTDGVNTGSNGKNFLEITMNAISDVRPYTNVEFVCEEFVTNDGDDTNDIRKADGSQSIYEDEFFTLSPAVNKEVASADGESLKFSWVASKGAENYDIYRKTADTDWALLTTVDATVTEYIDASIEEGVEYYYSVAARNAYGTINYDKTGVSGLYFGTVENLGINITESGASLTWSALNGAEYYEVYRKATADADWKKIIRTTETKYDDNSLTSGNEYFYTVKAYRGKYVATASVDFVAIEYVSAPNMEYAYYQINYNDITVNWGTVAGAKSYKVFRKAAGDTEYKHIATVESNAYVDNDVTAGETYSYKVSSVGEQFESFISSKSCDVKKLPITSSVVATLGVKNIRVTWEAVTPADSYDVWRKLNNAGTWQRIANVPATQTSYVDKAVSNEKSYIYAVSTRSGEYNTALSENSNSVYFIDSPGITAVNNTAGGITIEFSTVKGATSYNVFRKTVGGEFALLGTIESTKETVYNDSTAVTGVKYVYGVTAICGETESPMNESGVVCRLNQPEIKSLTYSYSGVTIEWNACTGAEKYIIYHGTTESSKTQIAEIDASVTSYTHKAAVSGETNYYYIKAVCGDSESTVATSSIYLPSAPVITAVTNAADGVSIEFSTAKGAKSYKIFRKTVGGEFALLGTMELKDGTVYKDSTAVSGVKYVYGMIAVSSEGIESLMSESDVICRLSQPEIKSLTASYSGITIKWNACAGAKKYIIYHGITESSQKQIAEVDASVISYTHKAAVSGRNNYYSIKAVCEDNESAASTEKLLFISAPVVNYIANGSNKVTIRWKDVDGAAGYLVYRRAVGSKSWSCLTKTPITATSYGDTTVKSGTDYEYTVRACDESELTSDTIYSAYNTSGWKIRFLATPSVKVANSYNAVKVSWGKVTGAKSYTVYRKTSGSSWKAIKTGVTSTSYNDTTAKNGTTYYYTVRAVYGNYTSYYNTKGVSVKYIASPAVKVANASTGVKVSWSKISGAKSYTVYRKTTSAKSWTKLATTTSTSYTDKKAKSGTTYVYTVKATDGKVNSGYNTSGWKIKFLSAPGVSSTSASKGKVAVKWAKVTGASQYEVYRKAGSGSWTKVATVKSSSTSYTDKKVKKNTTYAYKVRAVSGSAKGAFGSSKSVKAK